MAEKGEIERGRKGEIRIYTENIPLPTYYLLLGG